MKLLLLIPIAAYSLLIIWATKNYRNSKRAEEMAKYQPKNDEWNENLKHIEI